MSAFDHVEYLCGPRGCGGEGLLRAVVYIGEGRGCISFMDVGSKEWLGEPIWEARRKGMDIASSDALYAGRPRARCREEGARPSRLDVLTLDIDFKPPPVAVERDGGRYVIRDRRSGEVVKRASESRLENAVREVAAKFRIQPADVYDAVYWGEGERPSFAYILRQARRVHRKLAGVGADALFLYSGAKGLHVKLVMPKLYDASLRPRLARGLAEFLGISDADPHAFDVNRKLRVPYTVNSKTGNLAFIFNPVTGEEIRELRWPRPVDPSVIGFLIQPESAKPAMQKVEVRPRRDVWRPWVPRLEQVAAMNPKLREDCRKRFSAVFGCACAHDGLDVETCAEKLAAALGMQELGTPYRRAMERSFGSCARRIANRESPYFSIKNALTLDRDEEKGGVWYSIKECLTHIPPRFSRPAPQPQEARRGEPQEAEPAKEAVEPVEAAEESAEAGEERPPESAVAEELERFIREHLLEP